MLLTVCMKEISAYFCKSNPLE